MQGRLLEGQEDAEDLFARCPGNEKQTDLAYLLFPGL